MAENALKVGVIGAGRMGVTHHCIVNSHPGVNVVAVADPSAVVNKLLSKYAAVRAYKDYRTLLEKEHLDAVLVCTPPALNHEILTAAAEKGLHAFVEKPFTLSSASGAELTRRFEERGLVGQVGYVSRFNNVFEKVKEFLEADLLGRLIRFRSEMFSSTIIRKNNEDGWRSTHANGGGAAYEMASHQIDLINFLIGRPDYVTGTDLTKVFSSSVEDIISANFMYRSGVGGSIYVNWSDPTYRKPTTRFEVIGEKGKIQADLHGMKVFLNDAAPDHKLAAGWTQLYITDLFKPTPFYLRGAEFTGQMYHFIDHVQRRDPATRCSFADGTATLGVIDDMFRDYESNKKALG